MEENSLTKVGQKTGRLALQYCISKKGKGGYVRRLRENVGGRTA